MFLQMQPFNAHLLFDLIWHQLLLPACFARLLPILPSSKNFYPSQKLFFRAEIMWKLTWECSSPPSIFSLLHFFALALLARAIQNTYITHTKLSNTVFENLLKSLILQICVQKLFLFLAWNFKLLFQKFIFSFSWDIFANF